MKKGSSDKIRKIILSVLFVMIISIPSAAGLLSKISGKRFDVSLKGYFKNESMPTLTQANFNSGAYQTRVDRYIHQNFKPRGVVIKLANQLRFSLFREGSREIGRNGNIFEVPYLFEYCCTEGFDCSDPVLDKKIKEYAKKIAFVQEKLREQNKCLIVFTAPSKADYCNEDIPKKYVVMGNPDGIRASDCFDKYAEEFALNYIDYDEYFKTLDIDYPVYYKSGIHWSRPYEQKAEAYLLERINESGFNAGKLIFKDIKKQNKPFDRDSDSYDMLNIIQKPSETYYECFNRKHCNYADRNTALHACLQVH